MSEAEVAADLFKRDREAEQAFESIALNFSCFRFSWLDSIDCWSKSFSISRLQ